MMRCYKTYIHTWIVYHLYCTCGSLPVPGRMLREISSKGVTKLHVPREVCYAKGVLLSLKNNLHRWFSQSLFYKRRYAYGVRGCIQKLPDWVITKYTHTFDTTRWETTQRVIAAKLTRLTHKIAIQLHPVAENCTICSSRSSRPVRKLLDTPSYYVCPA
jgi:hypothetical protein